ncbi:MAG: hypothetical protein Q8Q12_14185 [bacterium]|nr:hypothetical protein [bacterium]
MTGLRTRTWLTGLLAVLCVATVGIVMPAAFAEEGAPPEGRVRPAPIDPEKAKEIWTVEAKCAAGAAEIKGEDVEKVVKAYIAAQQAYAEKVKDLPRTRESFEQRQEIATKANADLKEALTKAFPDKAEKVIGLLGPLGAMGSRLDRMVGDLIAFKLPPEKLAKAVGAVMENSREQSKLFAQARESGSFESVRDKVQPLTDALNKTLSEILSEEQMTQWKERYARPFGGGAGRGPGGGRTPGAGGAAQ